MKQDLESGLPGFSRSGSLPAGVYGCSFEQFFSRFGFNRRRRLFLSCFESFLREYKERGGMQVCVGGSFVTCKSMPSDIDFSLDVNAPGQNLRGLKTGSIKSGGKQVKPLHFIPEHIQTEDGKPFRASEFFQGDDPEHEKVGIVVIDLTSSFLK